MAQRNQSQMRWRQWDIKWRAMITFQVWKKIHSKVRIIFKENSIWSWLFSYDDILSHNVYMLMCLDTRAWTSYLNIVKILWFYSLMEIKSSSMFSFSDTVNYESSFTYQCYLLLWSYSWCLLLIDLPGIGAICDHSRISEKEQLHESWLNWF